MTQGTLTFAGTLFSVCQQETCLAHFLAGQYQEACTLLKGDYVGCFVSSHVVVFWKTQTSNRTLFYRRDGALVRWSTTPTDLIDSLDDFTRTGLHACCWGENAWIYQQLHWTPAGYAVVLTPERETVFPLQQPSLQKSQFPRRSLQQWAEEAFSRLCQAVHPLVACQKTIGVLLSGGIDSSALAAALVYQGASVIGYHFAHKQNAANERSFAQAVCTTLNIPFRWIPASIGPDYLLGYLSQTWIMPHPYGHGGYRWFEQIADLMRQDRVTIAVTGRYADTAFGPLERYSIADILSAPLPWKERWNMLLHSLSTNWELPDLFRSFLHSDSLINSASFSRSDHVLDQPKHRADFLSALPNRSFLTYSPFATERSLDFSPQDLATEELWHHYGIEIFHPYSYEPIQEFAAQLPYAYRFFPFQGQKITKPVLRLAFAHLLPPEVLRRVRCLWLNVPGQTLCLNEHLLLAKLLGSDDAWVVRLGFVNQERLRQVLTDPSRLRANSQTLIATAMVELFLRQHSISSLLQ
ncbi:asparagine synthase C-terminal domain-containing protein [Thermosporothrix hazakensis]|uniref:asparagine synthase-related protein n=1 Tax=Thermosporothrix hazakensis TaxID=644383 RepID=UPI0014772732|nr:asparagine synthase C-terminal domain-containing protein [Thermosporothrix hazakensis]